MQDVIKTVNENDQNSGKTTPKGDQENNDDALERFTYDAEQFGRALEEKYAEEGF